MDAGTSRHTGTLGFVTVLSELVKMPSGKSQAVSKALIIYVK